MEKKNILITGVSGLLGHSIARALTDEFNIIGLDLNPPTNEELNIHFYYTDLTQKESIKNSLKQVKNEHGSAIVSVIHLAAYYDFAGEPSPLYDKLTVNGTRELLEQLGSSEINYEQFIFSSTHLVAKDNQKGELITEDCELEGTWDYPTSKINAEKVINDNCKKPYVILRISGVYDDEGHSPPICQQISRIYEKKIESFLYPGDPDKGQPFVHRLDVVSCVRLCIEERSRLDKKEIFFVCETELLSFKDLQVRIRQLLHGENKGLYPIPKVIAKLGAWIKNTLQSDKEFIKPWMIDLTEVHYPLSNKKIRDKLKWKPEYRLYESLEKIIQNLQKNPNQWYEENNLGNPPPLRRRPKSHKISHGSRKGKAVPPWDYNPSSWRQRIPICILASFGFFISAYLACFQWDIISSVWDPFFGDQSEKVIDSDVSHWMYKYIGIPDAALGAYAYLGDAIFGIAGSTDRWRNRPWLVIIFGFDVIPLGIVSIILVLIQGFYLGSWCFLCLVTATISLVLILMAYDEVWSSLRYLFYVRKKYPKYFWNVLWGIRPPQDIENSYFEERKEFSQCGRKLS